MEILRDPIRLGFALLGPIILIFAFGFGISFDVEDLRFAVLEQDRSLESREFLESFEGSRYFQRVEDIARPGETFVSCSSLICFFRSSASKCAPR